MDYTFSRNVRLSKKHIFLDFVIKRWIEYNFEEKRGRFYFYWGKRSILPLKLNRASNYVIRGYVIRSKFRAPFKIFEKCTVQFVFFSRNIGENVHFVILHEIKGTQLSFNFDYKVKRFHSQFIFLLESSEKRSTSIAWGKGMPFW